jgi:enamine deaminase RidA (YjgF/YER057c/UK114 family)
MIKRLPGAHPNRSRSVVFNGTAQLVVVSPHLEPTTYAQASSALAELTRSLEEIGSAKEFVLSVMVYLARMEDKQDLNRAWDEWSDQSEPPMRACVGATLTGDHLVELVVSAAVPEGAGES